MRYLLGVDDTDSRFGHCTTHLGYLIASELDRLGFTIPAYPRLVRLNPNIPFKTRGNAAVCVEFEAGSHSGRDEAFAVAERLLLEEADVENGANSALVLAEVGGDLSFFAETYVRAIGGVVNYRGVLRKLEEGGYRKRILGNGMGAVGAASSVGFAGSEGDHTFELIAYRRPEYCGTPRRVDRDSVRRMEFATFPRTFSSFDHESGRMLVCPTGPDPVLVGVRGESPRAILDAFGRLELGEEALGYMVYATNQCTDAHLGSRLELPLKAYHAGWIEGSVERVSALRGSHMAIALGAGGSTVDCMVYEPSGDLRRMVRLLRPGDRAVVYGGVRRASSKNPAVVNVEKLEVVRSTGGLAVGTYLPSPRSQRHLTKQLVRYGRERPRGDALVEGWLGRDRQPSKSLRLKGAGSSSAVGLAITARKRL